MLSRTWTRIAFSYFLLLLITALALALLLGGEFDAREEAGLRARLIDQAHGVAYVAEPLFIRAASITETTKLAHAMSQLYGTRVTLIRPDGVVVGDSEQDPALMENHAGRAEVAQALADPSSAGSSSRVSATVHRPLLYVAVAVTEPGNPAPKGVARIAYPLTSVEGAREALWRSLAIAALLITLPAILLSLLLARLIAGPISVLRSVANRLGQGDLSARYRASPNGEIGALGSEFNSMAGKLAGTIIDRTAERNQVAALLEHMHDGVVVTDVQGRVERINRAAAGLLGHAGQALEAVAGRSLIEVAHSYQLHEALGAALAKPSERQRLTLEVAGRNVEAVVTVVPAAEQNPVGEISGVPQGPSLSTTGPRGLIVLQDMTELR
ncbi:MAG: cell wall metabolism sensor histidine kinase WalK, partial [Chloroflexota bacterium]|nr:cell wall metabolism sensor histidine kinase WalK [Chloroflexota bacterium]